MFYKQKQFNTKQYIDWLAQITVVKDDYYSNETGQNTARRLEKNEYKKISRKLAFAKSARNVTNVIKQYLWNEFAFPNAEVFNLLVEKLIEFGKIEEVCQLYINTNKYDMRNKIWFSIDFRQPQWNELKMSFDVEKIAAELKNIYSEKISKRFKSKTVAQIIYSAYLQNLVYVIVHATRKINDEEVILRTLIADKLFFHKENNNVICWKDGKEGYSALNSLCKEGHTDVVKELIKSAKEAFKEKFQEFINQKNKGGFTPINNATYNKYRTVAYLLFFNNANPRIPNKSGFSAVQNAKRYGRDWNFLINARYDNTF